MVGPGLMGLGLCHAAAGAGIQAVLVGRDRASALRGLSRLGADLQKRVSQGRLDAAARDAILDRVTAAPDVHGLSACTLVVEAVAEDRGIKTEVLRRIESVVADGALIATNTSGLPVSGLASALSRPERFVGMHFFSPVDRMALVELVVGAETSSATTRLALEWAKRLGKTPIVVRDGPGFFTSRVFAAYLDEAAAMVAEGVAPASIEAAAASAGMPIGPLAMLDETGIALNWQQARQARADGLPERFCRPLSRPVLDALMAAGRRGRRDGGGFYDYPEGEPKQLWPGLGALHPPLSNQPDIDAVRRRLMHAQALEAARCLEEGTVATAREADIGSMLGLGFPKSEGGVLTQVEKRGLAEFESECDALADLHGERFRPSPWLRRLAVQRGGFAET
ncbi:3-hydroxyacyl-CoA dehydrogenase family protein [Variovorax sp. GT1P44]|uniref:3-hydroxyacyl-CoA dehydrogenase family protein n=1 Tax=Variovorax sp. GT1P44 TaxID=3443742 RepID=UPI003F44CACD